MKKTGIINQPIAALIAGLGHTDMITIADAGLPIPPNVTRIDIALQAGTPSLLETVKVVLSELHVERAIIAQEAADVSPNYFTAFQELMGDIPIDIIPHEELKQLTHSTRGIIRTGEFTPFANIILVAGVVF